MSRLVAAPPPNRVRSPTDRHFASSCSPRRFGPTQLPLATELWHTPARTFTVLMWRPHGRTQSREGGNLVTRTSLNDIFPQIFPIWIFRLNQFQFPGPIPFFHLLLTSYG